MELQRQPTRLVHPVAFEAGDPLELPLYLSRVSAGFTSPADDHVDRTLDLNAHCVQNPASTYLAEIEGDSLVDLGIFPGDIAVVDRSVEPDDGDVVVAALNGELVAKVLRVRGRNGSRRVWLVAANEAYPPIEVLEGHDLVIWGVVTNVIHRLRR